MSRTPSNGSSNPADIGEEASGGGDSERVGFQYPEFHSSEDGQKDASEDQHIDSEDEFTYPGSPTNDHRQSVSEAGPSPIPPITRASPAQLEAIYAAGSSGDLDLLQKLFSNAKATGDVESFALANDASPRTGLTVVHASASRGHAKVVKWCKY